jgi:choline dehydrogenase-like flavoprotein
MDSWEFAGRNRLPPAELAKQEKQNRTGYTTHPASAHWFVDDIENPYSEVKRFDWMRATTSAAARCSGGGQSYRFSELDWEANARDGVAVDWPIRSADMSPWYDYVERFAGISGTRDGLPQLPDGQFLPPMEMNCLEKQVKDRIARSLRGPSDDHRTRGEPDAAAQRPRHLPVQEPLHSRLSVRRYFSSNAPRCRPPTPPAS